MNRGQPKATRTDTLCPCTTLFRACSNPGRSRRACRRPAGEPRWTGRRPGSSCADLRQQRGLRGVRRFAVARFDLQVAAVGKQFPGVEVRSEEHTSELQSLMRSSYAVFCLKKKNHTIERYSRV